MDQFTCILFHMHFMNADFLFPCRGFNLYPAIMADWQVQLRDLIVLRVIRVEIVFTVKFAVLINLAISCKPCFQGKFYYFLIQYRKGTRHTCADRACMCIRCSSELCGASAENFRFCGEFYMDLKSYDCFVLFHYLVPPSPGTAKEPRLVS